MQFLGTHINIAQQDVIGNNILNKAGLIMLFLIIILGTVQGHGRHGTKSCRHLILAGYKGSVIHLVTPATQGDKGTVADHDHTLAVVGIFHNLGPLLTHQGQFVTGNYGTVAVHNTNGTVGAILHLKYYTLKNSTGHQECLLMFFSFSQTLKLL